MTNHYGVLGVLPLASTEEIKASYRQLAKRYHPDVPGGNARTFARIREAYDVLCDAELRRRYDAERSAQAPRPAPAAARPAQRQPAREEPSLDGEELGSTRSPLAVLTRIMSMTVPRSGRFQLQGLIGDVHIVATTPENLWETTLRKYGTDDSERLARHVIQIKLSGERDLVRTLMPRPTDFGVEFEQATPEERQNRLRTFLENLLGGPFGPSGWRRGFGLYGARLPLTLQVTVPRGTPLSLRDVTGAITVGNVEGEVVAKLLGGVIRTGRIAQAHLTLNGGSLAFLSDVRGPVDLMGFGKSRVYLGGRVPRLRVVLENEALVSVSGAVASLMAEVNGRARLEVKRPVNEAHCDVADSAHVRLARVRRLSGTRSPRGRVEAVLERPPMPIAG